MVDSDAPAPIAVSWSLGASSGTESVDSFFEEVARLSATPGALLAKLRVGSIMAKRYELLRPIGRGAHGVVWAARDSLTESDVALKVLVASSREQSARVRTEVASLRRLRIPGVVRLLDEGVEGGSVFLAMPIVRGRPFPGTKERISWTDLAPIAKSLLEAIAQVHLTGIVHCDLKPENVLVGAGGQTTILDFGLALAPTFGASSSGYAMAGTPIYLAPEQASGRRAEATVDLYAIGVMIYHALSGRFPHEASDLRELLIEKQLEPPPLAKLGVDAPEHVSQVIDSLLSIDPRKRAASAAEAWAQLESDRASSVPRSGPRNVLPLDAKEPLSLGVVRDLFEGRDRVSWIREDTAALLYERTQGDPNKIRAEIAGWLRAGVCRLNGDSPPRLILDEEAVTLDFDLAYSSNVEGAGDVIARAKSLAENGRLDQAIKCLDWLLGDFRRTDGWPVAIAEQALSLWVECAFALATPRSLDRVLYEICRVGESSPLIVELEALVRASLAVGAWTDRALELASALSPFDDQALERLRQGVRVNAARRTSLAQERALIAELVPGEISASAETKAAMLGWLGRLKYGEGDFDESAKLHGEAASGSTWATRRIASLNSQASALTEAFRFDEASEVAERAFRSSLAARNVYGRARAELTMRMLGYRRAARFEADLEWVEAIAGLRIAELEALACLTETAGAWRSNTLGVALKLAERATQAWASVGERGGGLLLVRGLAVVCNPSNVDQAELKALSAEAMICTTPGIGIQVLGLIAPHWSGPRHDDAHVAALAAQVPRKYWRLRIDVLSVDEAILRLKTAHGTHSDEVP